jgi:hypothetical protein
VSERRIGWAQFWTPNTTVPVPWRGTQTAPAVVWPDVPGPHESGTYARPRKLDHAVVSMPCKCTWSWSLLGHLNA